MKRLFLDANILFTAAHRPQGKAAFIIEMASEGHWQICASQLAEEEARRNLERKYPEALARFEELIQGVERAPDGHGIECPIALPEKDRPIMEAAIRANATHLLTGDLKHFGPFMNDPERSAGIIIQTVSDFLFS